MGSRTTTNSRISSAVANRPERALLQLVRTRSWAAIVLRLRIHGPSSGLTIAGVGNVGAAQRRAHRGLHEAPSLDG